MLLIPYTCIFIHTFIHRTLLQIQNALGSSIQAILQTCRSMASYLVQTPTDCMLYCIVSDHECAIPDQSNISIFSIIVYIETGLLRTKFYLYVTVRANRWIRGKVISLQTLLHVPNICNIPPKNVHRHDVSGMWLPNGWTWRISYKNQAHKGIRAKGL